MKKAFVMVLSVLMMTLLLAGCGNKNNAATPDSTAADGSVSSRITETAKVLETTSEGGTVEQDKEGNVIEKDKNGEIVSVKDKDGKTQDLPCDSVIISAGYIPSPVFTKGVHVIGDAKSVGSLRTVIWQAWDVAMKL